MKKVLGLLIIATLLACENTANGNFRTSEVDMDGVGIEAVEEVQYSYEAQPTVMSKSAPAVSSGAVTIEKKIIKTAQLEFQTEDMEGTFTRISAFAKANNGYLSNDNTSTYGNRTTRSIVLRVPSEKFDATLAVVSEGVGYFDTKSISARDVTEEFVDIEARLKTKRALEQRFISILAKAKNVTEILEIERQLAQVREEIESREGRLKYLKSQVSLSTLNIQFYKETATSKVSIGYGGKMWRAIQGGVDGIGTFFIGILYLWPFILLLGIGLWLLRRWLKRRKKS